MQHVNINYHIELITQTVVIYFGEGVGKVIIVLKATVDS